MYAQAPVCRSSDSLTLVNQPARPVVLLVDDDDLVRATLRRALLLAFDVEVAAGVDEAVAVMQSRHVDFLVTDLSLKDEDGRDGWWLLEKVTVPGLVLTGSVIENAEPNLVRKPISPRALIERIQVTLAGHLA